MEREGKRKGWTGLGAVEETEEDGQQCMHSGNISNSVLGTSVMTSCAHRLYCVFYAPCQHAKLHPEICLWSPCVGSSLKVCYIFMYIYIIIYSYCLFVYMFVSLFIFHICLTSGSTNPWGVAGCCARWNKIVATWNNSVVGIPFGQQSCGHLKLHN